jgi:acyl-CoA thioesterase
MGFDDDIAVGSAGGGTFDVDVPAHWRVGRGGTNGGYVAAVIVHALETAVAEPARRPRSLTIHYLSPCRPGAARIAVTTERAGRSLSTLSARMTQGEATVAIALSAFAHDRPGLDFEHEPMPEAPPPADIPPFAMGGGRPSFSHNWDYRFCVGAPPYARANEALSGGWIRPLEPRRLDAPMLAAMADAWIPPVIPLLGGEVRGMLPTIDLTVHFRSAPPAGMAPDDFSFAVFQSKVGAEGYWESDGVIWSPDGGVLVQARQLAVFNLPTS